MAAETQISLLANARGTWEPQLGRGWKAGRVQLSKVPVSYPVEMQCKHAKNSLPSILSTNSNFWENQLQTVSQHIYLFLACFASILSSPCSGVQEQSETRAEWSSRKLRYLHRSAGKECGQKPEMKHSGISDEITLTLPSAELMGEVPLLCPMVGLRQWNRGSTEGSWGSPVVGGTGPSGAFPCLVWSIPFPHCMGSRKSVLAADYIEMVCDCAL